MPTSHFDLIWRRPVRWYRRRRAEVYRAVLGLLEKKPEFHYTFCQTLALEQFIADHPRSRQRLKQFVDERRLEIVGAPVTIPDLNLSSGEAIVRNQMLGLAWQQRALGQRSATACFEDAFGVPASLPQIMLRCGMRWCLFKQLPCVWLRLELDWRGNSTEISWALKSGDHSAVPRVYGAVPFGFVERKQYEPGRDGFTGEVYPSPMWSATDRWLVLHRGQPAFRAVPGGLENVLLRSPVKRWMPLFPVQPDLSAWENGWHVADFLLVPQTKFDGARAARLGLAFQISPLAAKPVTAPPALRRILDSVPDNLVVTSLEARPKGWRLRVHEARGQRARWKLPAGVPATKQDFTGQRQAGGLSFRPFEIADVVVTT